VTQERELERRLRTLSTLEQAIGALRSLSARHFLAARAPLASARAYRDEIGAFLAALDTAEPREPNHDHSGIVLVTADLGLVGDYSARLTREALDLRRERGDGPLLCVGHRAVPILAKSGVEPTSVRDAPSSVAGLSAILLSLVDELLRLRRAGALESLWLVAARFEGAGHFSPMRVPVLPMEAPAGRPQLPISPYCAAPHVRAVVVREYLYAVLYETMLESLASEHGKRLVVAEGARSWLDDRIDATRRLAASVRRESSTREVLEIAAGARAVRRRGVTR
jgi:F-type H+-transporting ATPase subunit gamma